MLFHKFLQGHCTPGEVKELVALLEQAASDNVLDAPMKALWQKMKADKQEYEVDWDKMYHTISHTGANVIPMAGYYPLRKRRNIIYQAAAAIVVLLAGATIYWYSLSSGTTGIRTISQTYQQAPARKRQVIHLPDGSTVTLNANSRLKHPPAFNGSTRDVYLTGEAYFDIKHHPEKPFLVHTGMITTKVLGTAFDVKAYPGDAAISISVTRGKVQVLKENKTLGFVTANQQIAYNKTTDIVEQKAIDVQPIIAWKPGEIVFDDITMVEMARQIGQRFDMKVEFANPAIRNCRVSASFSDDDMLDEMLTVVCGVTKSNYTIQNNKVIINGKGCN